MVLQAFYRSGRPVDIIAPDGWHMALANFGDGVQCVGMWREGEPVNIVEWKHHLDGIPIQTRTSTVKMALDCLREMGNGCRIESIQSGRYNR